MKSTWQIKAEELTAELDRFKKTVVDTTWDWDGGTEETKRDFLESLSLESPKRRVFYAINVYLMTEGDGVVDSQRLDKVITDAINNSGLELATEGPQPPVQTVDYYED